MTNIAKLAKWIEGRSEKGVSGRGNSKHESLEMGKNLEDWGWSCVRWLKHERCEDDCKKDLKGQFTS